MHNKAKRILTAAVTALFALSVGYFAVLPPTSAWFYQKYLGDEKTFVFGKLDVDETYTQNASIEFIAATKLEDPDETQFNDVVQIVTINAHNIGTLPARVYATVNSDDPLPNGLRYFFYCDADGNEGDTVRQIIDGKGIITGNDHDATYTALDLFNLGNFNDDAGHYILVQPGETKELKIAFWTDYTAVSSLLEDTGNVTELASANISIQMTAVQDTDGAFTRAA